MATEIAEDVDIDVSGLPDGGELEDGQEESGQQSSPRAAFQLSRQKLKVIVLLLVVMGVQMAIGYSLLPEPTNTSMANADESADGTSDDTEQPGIGETVEVPLGKYNLTNSRGVGIVHVSFNLTAIVAPDNEQPLRAAFSETHGARIKASVIRVIRSSNLEDLNDPDSYVIKRKIREEVNKVLPKTLIVEVVLDEFRMMEQ